MVKRMTFFGAKKRPKKSTRPTSFRRGYGGPKWDALRKAVLIRDSYLCQHCSKVCTGPREAHVDHIGGSGVNRQDEVHALQTLCAACHGKKTCEEQRAREGL